MANDLSLNGAVFGTGKFAQAIQSGSGASLAAFLDGVVVLAIQFVASTTATNGLGVAVSKVGRWWVGRNGANAQARYGSGGGEVVLSTAVNVADGLPHDYALSIGSDGANFYVDGQLAASSSQPLQGGVDGNPVVVGAYGTAGDYAWSAGYIDELVFWNSKKYTGTTITTPSAAYTGSEIGMTALYHLDGNGNDSHVVATAAAPTVTTPVARQIKQRAGTTGTLTIAGYSNDIVTRSIEASFNGGAYQTIATGIAAGAPFSGNLTNQAQGQGSVIVRYVGNTGLSTTVTPVGIGELFLVTGQSNASGRGDADRVYTPTNGIMASLFDNANNWGPLTDPTDRIANQVDTVSQDDMAHQGNAAPGGSIWPLLATSLVASLGVPVGFVVAPLGGTRIDDGSSSANSWRIPSNHQDRTSLLGSAVYRALLVGGVKANLFYQGESDAIANVSQSSYAASLNTFVDAINIDLGVPTIAPLEKAKTQTFSRGQSRRRKSPPLRMMKPSVCRNCSAGSPYRAAT